jgi:hypothetical protein
MGDMVEMTTAPVIEMGWGDVCVMISTLFRPSPHLITFFFPFFLSSG